MDLESLQQNVRFQTSAGTSIAGRQRTLRLPRAAGLVVLAMIWASSQVAAFEPVAQYRGPIDLVVATDESWAVTANQLSGTLSLVNLGEERVDHELQLPGRPSALARLGNQELLVTSRDAGRVFRVRIADNELVLQAELHVGFEPLGIAVDSERAFVGLQATGEVAELDLPTNQLRRRFAVGRWPRTLALSPNGERLAIGLSGDSSIAVADTETGEVLYEEPISGGINIGQLQPSADGQHVYFPWMVYRTNPINPRNIRRGWILASRVARIRFDGPEYREAISLDVPGLAVADPYGIAITPDEQRLIVTSSGTHELLVYRLPDLPLVGAGGPGDLIDEALRRDPDRFRRIELGGRPLGMHAAQDSRTVWVANHLLDRLQIVDIRSGHVRNISLGPVTEDEHAQLVHRGMEIFHDARRSLDQWYSCHSCHLDGGSNARPMDTWNDGTDLTPKTVLPLVGSLQTAPWTWHGWQEDFQSSLQNSFVSTMQGDPASPADLAALQAYIASLRLPNSPFLTTEGQLTDAAERGRSLFHDQQVGCGDCHAGTHFSDGLVHDVGLGGESDKYDGYNTPSLAGVHRKVRFLHDGRAKSLRDVLIKWHRADEIGGGAELSESEIADLVAYLKSL